MGTVFRSIEMMLLPFLFLLCLTLPAMGEKVQQVSTHTSSCFSCGMIEGTSYLTVKICGGCDCCLSRSLDNDDINWIPGQTDRFHGPESLLECADFEVRADRSTVKCNIDHKLDDHSFVKAYCT